MPAVPGTGPTSVLPGSPGPDQSQCPLHTLFLSSRLRPRGGRPAEAGEEEGELPAGVLGVLAAVHGVERRPRAVLCPQAAGSGERGREREEGGGEEQMVARLVLGQREA